MQSWNFSGVQVRIKRRPSSIQRWVWSKPTVLLRPLFNCVIFGCSGQITVWYCLILSHSQMCPSSVCPGLRAGLWQYWVLLWQCSNHYCVVMGQNVIMFTGLPSQDGLQFTSNFRMYYNVTRLNNKLIYCMFLLTLQGGSWPFYLWPLKNLFCSPAKKMINHFLS